MRQGRFNKAELARLSRCYESLHDLMEPLRSRASGTLHPDETACFQELVTARNAIGILLAWQDHANFVRLKPNGST